MKLRIDDIVLSGNNMRDDVGDIDELSWSIRKHGILQPLLVRPCSDGYELVFGHRRLAAARRAGLAEVPVIVKDLSDDEALEEMIVENVHRKHLSPLEEGWAFEKMVDKGLTQYEVASRIGKSQTYVSNRLKVLELEPELRDRVHKGEVPLLKALDANREHRLPGGRHKETRPGELRWQIYYVDRLINWMEAGRLIDDDMLAERLILLSRALKAFAERGSTRSGGGASLPPGIHMCEQCGTVVDVSECCDEHGELCPRCKEHEHGEAA